MSTKSGPEWSHRAIFIIALLLGWMILESMLWGAIIAVNTVGGQRPPSSSPPVLLPEGTPLDFQYCALLKYAKEGLSPDEAVKRAIGDVNNKKTRRQENYNFNLDDVLVDIISYPSLYADVKSIHPDERIPERPTNWHSLLKPRTPVVDETVGAVGRIEVCNVQHMANRYSVPQYASGAIAGTGFYVGNNIVMTNRHVAIAFTSTVEGVLKFKKDPPWAREAVVWMNFAGTYDGEPRLVRVAETLYVAPDGDGQSDVALLRLAPKPGDVLPNPVRLQTTMPEVPTVSRPVLVCGYPSWSSESKPDLESRFQTLRVKRVSLGQTVENSDPIPDDNLRHNCPTLEGSSGSPLVDLESGMTWGIHSDGTARSNIAQPMWKIFKDENIKRYLTNPNTSAFSSLPPLNLPENVVVIKQTSRPVVFICKGDVAEGSENLLEGWLDGPDGVGRRANLRRSVRSVGLITYSKRREPGGADDNPSPASPNLQAVGFVVADDVVMTPSFNLTKIASDGLVDPSMEISIDFSGTVCGDEPEKFTIQEIIHGGLGLDGVTLLRMVKRPDRPFPPPLTLQPPGLAEANDRTSEVFVVGYPHQDLRTPPGVFNRVFPPPYGVKRLALGRTLVGERFIGNGLHHDCSTSVGDAGGAPDRPKYWPRDWDSPWRVLS